MQHLLKQTVIKLFIVFLFFSTIEAKEIPVMKVSTVEIPVHEYSVIKFPFKITNIQLGGFKYRKAKDKLISPEFRDKNQQQITLSKKGGANNSKVTKVGKNVLNIERIDNMLTFRPNVKGRVELIVWGYKDFPMIIELNVKDTADKDIEFVQLLDKRDDVINFEANPHEKVIEKIMRFLYNSNVNPKPRGYENIIKKKIYDVEIKDRDNNIFARIRVSLLNEIVGKKYIGQIWNVNIVPEFDVSDETINIPDAFSLNLYEEMFDSPGVYAVSIETYTITKEHGTRVMLVRKKDGGYTQ